jgi:Skp family chaperone for outer membrane proteins
MKRFVRLVLWSGCILVLTSTFGRAQTPGATSTAQATLVAVVDIAKVFEAHPTFKSQLESLQQQAKSADLDLEAQKKDLSQQGQQLSELDPGSPDYLQLETNLARHSADLQVHVRQVKKDLLLREARQYFTSFTEIQQAVERVARKHGIGLVLRFDSRAMDPSDPQSVMQGMNRAVVLQRNLDITGLVIEELRLSVAVKATPGTPRR